MPPNRPLLQVHTAIQRHNILIFPIALPHTVTIAITTLHATTPPTSLTLPIRTPITHTTTITQSNAVQAMAHRAIMADHVHPSVLPM